MNSLHLAILFLKGNYRNIVCVLYIWHCNWFPVRFAFATVEQLSPSHDYQFRVIAENVYGRSEPCEPTAVIKTETEQEGRKKKGLSVEGRSLLSRHSKPTFSPAFKRLDTCWHYFRAADLQLFLLQIFVIVKLIITILRVCMFVCSTCKCITYSNNITILVIIWLAFMYAYSYICMVHFISPYLVFSKISFSNFTMIYIFVTRWWRSA